MEEARLAYSLIACFVGACMIFFGRYIILDATAKAYCFCGHEWNDHNVVPPGYAPTGNPKFSDHSCKKCGCKKYNKNEKDHRNTPSIRFFPR